MTAYSFSAKDMVKEGAVRVKTSILGGILTQWNRRRLVLLRRSSRGPLRLVVICESGDIEQTIHLNDYTFIARVDPAIRLHTLAITFRSRPCFRFSTQTEAEQESWYAAFEKETSSPNSVNVNVADELFNVYLLPTDKLNFSGECLLQVTPNELSLLDVQQPRTVLALWPLSTIRQYGNPNDENFTFIAGRSSPTGEGLFLFNTTEAHSIYSKISVVTHRMADARRIASISMSRIEGLGELASVSRSAAQPSRLGYNSPPSSGSHPDSDSKTYSPLGFQHHRHQQHQQQQQQSGRRPQQSASTTLFFGENFDVVGQSSPSSPAGGGRRLLLAPPPYASRDGGDQGSPIRRLFTAGTDESPSPPPTLSPSAAATRSAATVQPHSPSWSPPVVTLRRNAASDCSLARLPEYYNFPSRDDADAAVGGQGRQAGLFRCKASAAHIHDTPVDQRGRVVLPPPPPPKHHRRQQ